MEGKKKKTWHIPTCDLLAAPLRSTLVTAKRGTQNRFADAPLQKAKCGGCSLRWRAGGDFSGRAPLSRHLFPKVEERKGRGRLFGMQINRQLGRPTGRGKKKQKNRSLFEVTGCTAPIRERSVFFQALMLFWEVSKRLLNYPAAKWHWVELGTSATAPAEALDMSVAERSAVVSGCPRRRVMEAMIKTREGQSRQCWGGGISSPSPSCLPPPPTHSALCLIFLSLLSLHVGSVCWSPPPPVTLLITVSSHETFALLQMKTLRPGPPLYLAGRMCNYAVPLGPQSHSGAPRCPILSLCVPLCPSCPVV